MAQLMGHAYDHVHCTQFALLSEEISKLSTDVRVLVVGCLGGIIADFVKAGKAKESIEKAMMMISASLADQLSNRQNLKIFLVKPPPRTDLDFGTFCNFGMVRISFFC